MRRSVVIGDELWLQATKKARALGLSVSAVIRFLLRLWLRGEIKIEE